MVFYIGAALGAAAEEVAAGMEKKSERLRNLTDEAWLDHKNAFQKRRDKEELKAEAASAAIEKLAQLTDGNIDHAAAIYKNIGNPEDALTFVKNGQVAKSQGLLSSYIGEMPDDFESANLTADEYGKSFINKVAFAEGLRDVSDDGSGLTSGVTNRLNRKYQQMLDMGIAPADFVPTEVEFADLKGLNTSALIVPETAEAVKGVLTNLAITADANGDTDTVEKVTAQLANMDRIVNLAGGEDAFKKQVTDYADGMSKFIKSQKSINRERLVQDGILSYGPDGTAPEKITNTELYNQFIRNEMRRYVGIYGKDLTGTKLDAFNNALSLTINVENIASLVADDENKSSGVGVTGGSKPPLTDDVLLNQLQTNSPEAVINALVTSGLYTRAEAEKRVNALIGGVDEGNAALARRRTRNKPPPVFSPDDEVDINDTEGTVTRRGTR